MSRGEATGRWRSPRAGMTWVSDTRSLRSGVTVHVFRSNRLNYNSRDQLCPPMPVRRVMLGQQEHFN